ncbi:copper chaperone PCu(A)C [Lichenicola sp.]|uniref:copper chaperone PCu(A)C n=1 Tax=Lichenicola sp. TaxID=2804529 RepID=UPI003B00492B
MTRPRCFRLLATLALLGGTAAAPAEPPKGVSISDGSFIRISDHAARGFFTVTNTSDTAVLITGWQSPACSTLSFRDASASSPADSLSPLDKLTIPAKDKMVFARGGYHLQCTNPAASVQPGGTVPVTVSFLSGRTLTATFQVHAMPTGR